MHNNDQEGQPNLGLLVSWLNYTCSLGDDPQRWVEHPQELLMALLARIEGTLGCQIAKNITLEHSLANLELYLVHSMGKKLRPAYRTELYAEGANSELMVLLFYVLVHCCKRSEFIPKIMTMDCQVQAVLMALIQRTALNIESTLENKEVFNVIEQLETENNLLRKQLTLAQQTTGDLKERLEASLTDYRNVREQCDQHNKQREDLIRQLKIQDFSDYLELLREVDYDRKHQLATVERLEQLNSQIQKEKDQFRAKILDDSKTRAILLEELQRLRTLCKNLRMSTSQQSIEFDLDISQYSLKDYKARYSFDHQKENRPPCRTDRSMCLADLRTNDESVMQLQHECQTVRESYEALRERFDDQHLQLKQRKKLHDKLSTQNRRLQRQLTKLHELNGQLQERFTRHLERRLF